MDAYIFPYKIIGGKFLGSREKVLLVGGMINHTTQIEIVSMNNQEIGNEGKQLASINIPGDCSAMEMCGITRYAKSFAAVATYKGDCGSISLVEIQSDENEVLLTTRRDIERSISSEESIITSLAYYAHQSQLGVSTETGDIVVRDVLSASEVVRFNADYCGVNAIKFSNSGHLISIGSSSNGQLQIWDIRSGSPSMHRCATRPLQKASSRLTSLLTSNVNDYDMICGTSDGLVVQWDTRMNGYISHPVHANTAAVTALSYHPSLDSAVISGASDGVVATMEYACLGGGRNRRSASGQGVSEVDRCLLKEASAITSIDIDKDSREILVTSKLGGAAVLVSGY